MGNPFTRVDLSHRSLNVSKQFNFFNHLLVIHCIDDNCGGASTLGEDERSAACFHAFDQLGSICAKFGDRLDVHIHFYVPA